MRWVGKFMLAALAALPLSTAKGQVFATAVYDVAGAQPNDLNQPFLLSSVPTEVTEALGDYRRYCGRSQWEKAFKQLEKVSAAKPNALVPDKQGIMVPPAVLLEHLFAELPEEGKKAYRLFNDAEAKKLVDQAQGKDEADRLKAVATRFLFTSSGDAAADRYGDLLFEQGDFSHAIGAWRSVLIFRPDSNLSKAQLAVKVAIALAREGRWQEFQAALQQVKDRYAEASVTLGGANVKAVEHLQKLAQGGPADAPATSDPTASAKVRLPAETKPMWQFRWFAQVNPVLGDREGLALYDQMYGRQYASDFVPPVAVDDTHIYSDMVGYDVGIDLSTGKLAWRSGRFYDLIKADPNNPNQNAFNNGRNLFLEQSAMICAGDRVWTVARDPGSNNNNNNEVRYYLIGRDPATGKESFNSKSAKDDLKNWSISGMPVADADHLYMGAYKPNQPSDLFALCVNRADGKLLWNTKVGTYKTDPRNLYYSSTTRSSVPSLLLAAGTLYLDTHAGSLVQMNSATGEIGWGLNYDSTTPDTNRYYNQPAEQCTVSTPIMVDGILYFKGMRSRRLCAVDPDEPKVLWSRPVSQNAVLCGVDRERVYLGGEEITAYDLKTQQLLWSKPLPMATGWVRPIMTADRIYQFTPRGIYALDKQNGDVVQLFRGADMDSLGGRLVVTPRALVAVSNLAITAYPLEPADAAPKSE